ncbi:MAG: glycoside hydrolase family 2 [Ekhidna sp.]|nr:glycoside hydrolase family 2 [Ekhidna sp.]
MTKTLSLGLIFSVTLVFAQDISLNADWEFSQNKQDWQTVNIPHTWNNVDAHDDERGMYMGEAFYKKELFIASSSKDQVFLKFEGANQITQVSVNGKAVGQHIGGYTAFVVDISDQVIFDERNEILIKVDNAINQDVPPLSADFTFYGGVYRDVYLLRRNGTHFDLTDGSTKGVYISQNTVRDRSNLEIKNKIKTYKDGKYNLNIKLYDPNMTLVTSRTEKLVLKKGSNVITSTLSISNPVLWSVDDPNLYQVEVELTDRKKEQVIDHFTGKTGLRWFEMDTDLSFKLNGKTLKLIGANRHQDFENLGNALPDAIHRRDMKLLKQMGGNFIRIAHYPQDPALLEACDELGILVWEEIPIVNYISLSEEFATNSIQMVTEMIRQHYNHSSVIMWGFMNEVLLRPNKAYKANEGLTEEEYFPIVDDLHNKLDSTVRKEDPSRFVTIAHHLNKRTYEKAGLNNVTDVVGWNLYPGWYGNDPNWEGAGLFLDEFNKKHPDKGIIVAEYGAGADPRIHSVNPKRFDFSIEWQTRLHTNYLRQINERNHVMGGTIWNFVDFGSEGRSDAVPRINSKGLLTVNRLPKDSYLFYRASLSNEPFLAIGNTQWRKRKDLSATESLTHPIVIFTNQNSVEVTHNNQILGKYEVSEKQVEIPVPFIQGKNQIKVKTDQLQDYADYYVEIIPENLKNLSSKEIDISMNLGSHVYFHHEGTDAIWIPERRYQEGSIGYLDGSQLKTKNWKVGVGSEIFGSDLEPVYQTHRDTISSFKADVPNGWYEITLHFAEIYAKEKREKLANNLGTDQSGEVVDTERSFSIQVNTQDRIIVRDLKDFFATPIKTRVLVVNGKGIDVQLEAIKGSAFLSGIEIKGF